MDRLERLLRDAELNGADSNLVEAVRLLAERVEGFSDVDDDFLGEEYKESRESHVVTCIMCRSLHAKIKNERKALAVQNQWHALQVAGVDFWACPDHFPKQGATQSENREAFAKFMDAINAELRSVG